MVDEALLILQKLSQEEKNVLKTFEKRFLAIYPLKKHIAQLREHLAAFKEQPELKNAILADLQLIKQDVVPVFANLNFTSFSQEKRVLDELAGEKKAIFEELILDQAAGGEHEKRANDKITGIVKGMQEELQAIGKEIDVLEHVKDAVVIFQGTISREREHAEQLVILLEKTEQITTPADADRLMLAWQNLQEELEETLRREKADVYDVLQPLMHEKNWKEKIVEKYERMPTGLLARWFTKKITRQDVERDVALLTPAEFTHYQSRLFNLARLGLLTDDALQYLQKEGPAQAERQRIELARVTQLSTYDRKMRILNDRALMETAEKSVDHAKRENKPLAVLFIDIDYFKKINDDFGHIVGDQALLGIAQTIKKRLRKIDTIGRYGGEEIVVVSPDITRSNAIKLAEEIRLLVMDQSTTFAPRQVTISIGIAFMPDDGTDINKLIKMADKRMYVSKNSGRNRVTPTE